MFDAMHREASIIQDERGPSPFRLLTVRHLSPLRLVCTLFDDEVQNIISGRTGPTHGATTNGGPGLSDIEDDSTAMDWLASSRRATYTERLILRIPSRYRPAEELFPFYSSEETVEDYWDLAEVHFRWYRSNSPSRPQGMGHVVEGPNATTQLQKVFLNCGRLRELAVSAFMPPWQEVRSDDIVPTAMSIWICTLLETSKYMTNLRIVEISNNEHFLLTKVFDDCLDEEVSGRTWRDRIYARGSSSLESQLRGLRCYTQTSAFAEEGPRGRAPLAAAASKPCQMQCPRDFGNSESRPVQKIESTVLCLRPGCLAHLRCLTFLRLIGCEMDALLLQSLFQDLPNLRELGLVSTLWSDTISLESTLRSCSKPQGMVAMQIRWHGLDYEVTRESWSWGRSPFSTPDEDLVLEDQPQWRWDMEGNCRCSLTNVGMDLLGQRVFQTDAAS